MDKHVCLHVHISKYMNSSMTIQQFVEVASFLEISSIIQFTDSQDLTGTVCIAMPTPQSCACAGACMRNLAWKSQNRLPIQINALLMNPKAACIAPFTV